MFRPRWRSETRKDAKDDVRLRIESAMCRIASLVGYWLSSLDTRVWAVNKVCAHKMRMASAR